MMMVAMIMGMLMAVIMMRLMAVGRAVMMVGFRGFGALWSHGKFHRNYLELV